jgi:Coenzyme PQQ synthesis protein D (PqqD)
MSESSPDSVDPFGELEAAPHVYARRFGDEVVLLDFERGEYFSLNAVACAAWHAVATGGTFPAALQAIVAEFDVTEAQASSDTRGILEKLLAAGLLRRRLKTAV